MEYRTCAKSTSCRIFLLTAFTFVFLLVLLIVGYVDNSSITLRKIPIFIGIEDGRSDRHENGSELTHSHADDSKLVLEDYDKAANSANCTVHNITAAQKNHSLAMFHWARKPNSVCYGFLESDFTVLLVMSKASPEAVMAARINRLLYASTHGYKFCSVASDVDPSRPGAWHKVVALLTILPVSQWVFIMDADSFILDPTISLESIVSKYGSGRDIIFTTDFDLSRNGMKIDQKSASINTGVMLIRKTAWSISFWEKIYKDFPEAIRHPWWEQQATLLYRKQYMSDFLQHCIIIPYKIMNSFYPKYEDGDFIVHFAGPLFHNKSAKYNIILQAFFKDGNLCDQRLTKKNWKALVERCIKVNC